jgi:hypothetical protein
MKRFSITYNKVVVRASIVALSLLFTISSCKKDFLKAVPELSLSDENAFDSPERVLAQINGLYSTAKAGGLYGGRYPIYNDIRAEEFRNRLVNGVTGATVWNATNTSSDTYIATFWNQSYLLINRINVFLEGLEVKKAVLTPALYENYKAEAKFLRGYAYLGLVQIFAKPYILNAGASRGLPLRLKGETSSANNVLKSSTVAQIYTQILADLNDAETGLPANYATPLLNTTRAHKNTAIAIKSRVYLVMGNYAKVIEEGNKIVPLTAPFQNATRVAHALQANVANVFTAPYTTSESIFSFPMADTNAPGTQNQIGYYFNAGNLEYTLNTSAPGIYADAAWPASDARKTSFTALYSTALGYLVKKFSGVSPYLDYVPQIRYAEVLLNVAEAEALVAGGNLTRSRALLDAVRKRSDATYEFGTLASSTELVDAILKERRIEFLAEGLRYNDIARKAAPLPSLGAGASIPVTDPRYTFPIPDSETYYNTEANW